MAPDEFADVLDTPEFAAMPAHERAAVFDAGQRDAEEWLKVNGLEDEKSQASLRQSFQSLAVRHRPAQADIEMSQQGPLGTFVNRVANIGPDALSAVGGLADLNDTLGRTPLAGISPLGAASQLTEMVTGFNPLRSISAATKDIQAEGERLRPTNPANATANTLGGAVNQVGAMLATGGAAVLAGAPVKAAATIVPQVMGFGAGAGQGLDTARQMGIENPLGQAAMGMGFGGVEALTEKIGGIGGDLLKPAVTLPGRVLQNLGVEAGEEMLAGTATDALTVAAGQAVADPDRPGFTQTGYELPSLNPLNEMTLNRRMQEAIGGAAGGTIYTGLQMAAERGQAPNANENLPPAQTPPAAESEPAPEAVLPPDQSWIAGWEPIETAITQPVRVGGGNVIADFGIQRTPEAQAIVDAETAQRAGIEGRARQMQSMAGNGRPMIPDSPLGSYDILDFVNEHPLNVPRKGTEGGRGAEYDWSQGFEMPAYYRKFLVSTEKGYNPDALAQMAHDENLIAEPTPDALIAAMQETMRTRTQYKAQFRQQAKDMKLQEQQAVRFDKSQAKPAGKQPLPMDDLMPGDEFSIDGEPVKVLTVNHDEDGFLNEVVIEDGKAFGVLSLDPQTRGGILVDKLKTRKAGSTASRQATVGQTAAAATAPPRGGAASSGAGGGEASGMMAAMDTPFNITQAQLPRQQTPIGPIRAPGEVVTLKGIREALLAATMLPRVGVRRYSTRALGLYKIKPEAIRLRALNDLPTLAHEIGHAIHFRQLSANPGGPAESWGGAYDSELMPLGQVTSTKNYTPDQVRMEGVAEWTRLWLTDPAAALKAAPRFTTAWQQTMQATQPRMYEELEAARRQIFQYIAMSGWERAKAHLVFDADSQRPKRSWGEWTRGAYAKWFNTLQPAYDVLAAIQRADSGLAAEAIRMREQMENHRGGHQSKAHADITLAQTDLNGKIIGDSLKNILAAIPPDQHHDFSTYLVLKRARELRTRGIKTGLEESLDMVTRPEMLAMEQLFEPARQKLLKFQANTVQMMVQSGLLSQESAKAMQEANQDYVPFYRLYEKLHGIDTGAAAGRNAGGVVDVGTGIRRIKGSDLAIIDPLQSIIRNTFVFRKLAEQNQIGVNFFGLMQKMQGHGQFADAITAKRVPTKISHEAVVNKLIEAGVIQDAKDVQADLAITMWQALDRPDPKTGEVIVRKDGKAQHWEVKDALLYNALKMADADAAHLFKDSPFWRAFFTIPARMVRFTATAGNPVFAFKNWFRDQIIAGIQTQTGFIPFWDGVAGAMKVITKHPDYAAWVMSGGKFSGLNASDRTYQAMVEELMPPSKNDRAAAKLMRGLRHVKKALTITSEILEEATRVQEFSRARAQGMDPMTAANLSKAVSMNFARAGQMARTLNMMIPFFNAGLQDMDMIMRQLADPKRRGRALMAAGLLITIPSLLAWAMGSEDEEIQNLPDWRKTQFWNFNLGPLAKLTGRPAFILSLPKPFLMGQLFGTSVERALDQATGRDPNGAKKAAQAILENTALHGDVTDFIPAAFKPLFQAVVNRDTFRGQDIVPDNMKHLDKAEQVNSMTSKTAQALGSMTGSSPLMIDHLLRGYLTGLGNLSSDTIDYTVTKLTEGDRNPGPSTDLFEWQPFKSFVGSPYAADGNVNRFYEAANDMESRLKAWREKAPTLDLNNASEAAWWRKHSATVMHYQQIVNPETKLTQAGQIRQIMQHMSDLNRAMKMTYQDATLDAATKRSTLIELSRARNETAKQGFQMFPEVVRKEHY